MFQEILELPHIEQSHKKYSLERLLTQEKRIFLVTLLEKVHSNCLQSILTDLFLIKIVLNHNPYKTKLEQKTNVI